MNISMKIWIWEYNMNMRNMNLNMNMNMYRIWIRLSKNSHWRWLCPTYFAVGRFFFLHLKLLFKYTKVSNNSRSERDYSFSGLSFLFPYDDVDKTWLRDKHILENCYFCHTRAKLTISDHLHPHLKWSAGATSSIIFILYTGQQPGRGL